MEIEQSCFYRVRDHGAEKVVLALCDGVSRRVRFIDHMTSGIEEAFDPVDCEVLARLGTAEEFWRDPFAFGVLKTFVAEGISLDTLESIAVVELMRARSIGAEDLTAIHTLSATHFSNREQVETSRIKVWDSFVH